MEFNVFQNNKALMKVQEENGWKLYKFDDILIDDTRNAIKIKKELYLEYGEYPIIDQGKNEIAGYTNEVEGIYKEEALVFGDHTRIIKYIDFPIFLGADGVKLLKLKSNKEKISIKYLYYFLNTVKLPSDGYSRHFKYLKQIVIPVPELDIQMKIVKCLDKANELIDKRKKQIEALDELVKSKFVEMFGDPVKNTMNWEIKKVGDIAFVTKLAGFEYTQYINYQDKGEVIVVKGLNVKEKKLKLDDASYIDKATSDLLPRSQLKENDLVMTYVGINIGDVALVDGKNRYHLAPNVAKISLLEEANINPIFMVNLLYMSRILFSSGATSTAKQALNMGRIREINIMMPPLELQEKFAVFAKQVDKLKFEMEKSLKELEDNFNSLMQKAFKGELFN